MDSQGVFYQNPKSSDGVPLAPLEVTLFNPAYDKDRFENTALTLNGKLGDLKAVYTGGYLVRHVDQVGDYTNYSRGTFADYYQCYGPGSGRDATLTSKCFSPSASWRTAERNEHMQHEIRLSTPDEWRLRGIVGAYYEDNKLFDRTDWMYKIHSELHVERRAGHAGQHRLPLGRRHVSRDQRRKPRCSERQHLLLSRHAARNEADGGVRLVGLRPDTQGVDDHGGHAPFPLRQLFAGQRLVAVSIASSRVRRRADATIRSFPTTSTRSTYPTRESGFKSRGNLTWHITPDMMLYYTYSQGFRPGGFNQSGGALHAPGPDGQPQYVTPSSYHSDDLTNNEIGWKTELFNRRLQWNGAVYRENWNNVQVAFFDPGLIGNIFFNTNGQNFLVKGVETSLVARVVEGLTLQGAASWNQSRQTNSPALIDHNPNSVNFGKAITETCSSAGTNCAPITNPFGPIGSPSANSPPIQFSLRARYDWSVASYNAFAQFGATHTGHSFTQAGSNPTIASSGTVSTGRLRFEDPAYTTYDASLGVAKDAWSAHLYVQNLTNSNASLFTNTDQFIVSQTVLRPRVIGVAFGYKF